MSPHGAMPVKFEDTRAHPALPRPRPTGVIRPPASIVADRDSLSRKFKVKPPGDRNVAGVVRRWPRSLIDSDLPKLRILTLSSAMSIITAVLERAPDGTLHLPVPENLKSRRIKVVATLEAAGPPPGSLRQRMPRPDFAAIRRGIFGSDLAARRLTAADSVFIRDRGER
jgi:hypothetical protein